jgi:hypothetical protein
MNAEASRKSAAALPPAMRALLASWWLEASQPRRLVDWATDQIVAGQDSPRLRILAGLSGNDREETEAYFVKALAELGIPLPDRRECLVQYCGDVAREILAGSKPPLLAFNLFWRITMELGHPGVLRCWAALEADLDMMEYGEEPETKREEAVRGVCQHFLPLLEDYTETGAARFSRARSLETLRARGWNMPASTAQIPKRMPAADGEGTGASFFRTRVETEDFRDLTIPWTLFLRSEMIGCRFENVDLSESSMTWCDWKNCNFTAADLRGCDLRKSVFQDCAFYDAILDGADLRGAQFLDCRLGYASMKEAKLEKSVGLFKRFRRQQLRLSKEQLDQIAWTNSSGEEPPGG